MRIAVAADHAGYRLKQAALDDLRAAGHDVVDLGTHDPASPSDYPDVAAELCRAVISGRADRGLIFCGSGVGVAVVANKFAGIRAGVCHDTYSAHQAVEHDDMNVLCLGGRVIGSALAREIVGVFVRARFTNEERHARRLQKIRDLEREMLRVTRPEPQ